MGSTVGSAEPCRGAFCPARLFELCVEATATALAKGHAAASGVRGGREASATIAAAFLSTKERVLQQRYAKTLPYLPNKVAHALFAQLLRRHQLHEELVCALTTSTSLVGGDPSERWLQVLCASSQSISNRALSLIGATNSLRCLRLANCLGITDSALKLLSTLQNLQSLDLSGCSITDDGLLSLGAIPTLQMLMLNDTRIGDRTCSILPEMRQLRTVELCRTRVTDDCIHEITKRVAEEEPLDRMALPYLTRLLLCGNDITDANLALLADLPSIQFVDLMGTCVSAAGTDQLIGLFKRRKDVADCDSSAAGRRIRVHFEAKDVCLPRFYNCYCDNPQLRAVQTFGSTTRRARTSLCSAQSRHRKSDTTHQEIMECTNCNCNATLDGFISYLSDVVEKEAKRELADSPLRIASMRRRRSSLFRTSAGSSLLSPRRSPFAAPQQSPSSKSPSPLRWATNSRLRSSRSSFQSSSSSTGSPYSSPSTLITNEQARDPSCSKPNLSTTITPPPSPSLKVRKRCFEDSPSYTSLPRTSPSPSPSTTNNSKLDIFEFDEEDSPFSSPATTPRKKDTLVVPSSPAPLHTPASPSPKVRKRCFGDSPSNTSLPSTPSLSADKSNLDVFEFDEEDSPFSSPATTPRKINAMSVASPPVSPHTPLDPPSPSSTPSPSSPRPASSPAPSSPLPPLLSPEPCSSPIAAQKPVASCTSASPHSGLKRHIKRTLHDAVEDDKPLRCSTTPPFKRPRRSLSPKDNSTENSFQEVDPTPPSTVQAQEQQVEHDGELAQPNEEQQKEEEREPEDPNTGKSNPTPKPARKARFIKKFYTPSAPITNTDHYSNIVGWFSIIRRALPHKKTFL
ncbi:hypothetical protein QOT17_016208 [Balamuthia mandrillaris]